MSDRDAPVPDRVGSDGPVDVEATLAPDPGRPTGTPVAWLRSPARRRVGLPTLAAATVAAVVLGLLLGGWQHRLDVERSARADARLLISATTLNDLQSNQLGAADFIANGRSLGGPLLLHELRTPYGTIPFSPDLALDPAGARALPIRFRPDCSTYPSWRDDWSKAPRTATAMVRDRPRDPLRAVPVDLTGDLVIALAAVPCVQQSGE